MVENLFGDLYKQYGKDLSLLLLAGAAAFCRTLWLTRNDIIFDKCSPKTFCRSHLGEHIGSGSVYKAFSIDIDFSIFFPLMNGLV